jgi:phytol kinase
VRKLFHLGGGVLCLWIQWVFQDLAPVLALGAATIGLFAALRAVPALRDGPGQVLAGVKRPTVGEFCFVTSFCLLFWLSAGDRLLYGVPLLVLAVADSFAALVGTAYGRYHFRAWRGRKSVEGSVAFFLAAFLCVHVPVLLFTETGRTESLLIALNLALMVMMAEAAAWWGLDNLIIPLFSYVLLRSFLPMDATELIQHLAFLVGLSLFVRFWRQRTTLADDALFGVSLWGYVVWAMADWRWVVPPFLVILTYSVITRRTPHDHVGAFNFPVALANIVAGLLWLLLYHASGDGRYFYPFAAAFAANLAMIALVRHASWRPDSPMPEALGFSVVRGVLLLVPAILLVDGLTPAAVRNVISGAVAVALAAATFRAVQPAIDRFPVDTARWLRQAAVSIAASSLTLVPHLGPG